jgi:hypothetical protein
MYLAYLTAEEKHQVMFGATQQDQKQDQDQRSETAKIAKMPVVSR